LWYSDQVPWESFLPFVEAFNQCRRELLQTVYLLMDESMSAWRPKTSQYGGLPNLTYEPRKPKPLGTMFKNGVEATTGIMVTQDVVQGLSEQRDKQYDGDVSSLPLHEPIMAHVAETLRQCESANLVNGGWVGGDAWFGSIPCVVELMKKLGVYSTFIIKQNVQYCPLQVIQRIMQTRNKQGRRAGRHVVMKATVSGVDLFLLAYAWSNKRAAYIVSSCGTTVQHEIPYRSKFTDEYGNVTFKEIPRPSIAHFYFELCPLIDNHNKDRQGVLALEDCWPTKNPWFRLMTTMIGMSVVDMHRWDRNQRSGGEAFEWLNTNDERPDFLKVRSMTNLIARGLHAPHMRYYTKTKPQPPIRLRAGQRSLQQKLSRITNAEGETKRPPKRPGGKTREYQQTCYICRQYHKCGPITQWWCNKCNMPLCSMQTLRREISCYDEHCANQGDPVLGCCIRERFIMPPEYRLYSETTINNDNTPTPPTLPTINLFGDVGSPDAVNNDNGDNHSIASSAQQEESVSAAAAAMEQSPEARMESIRSEIGRSIETRASKASSVATRRSKRKR